MAAALTDKFRKSVGFATTTLDGGITDSTTTFDVDSATGWPTDTAMDIVVDRVDAQGEDTPNSREVMTVTNSAGTLTTDNTRRGLDGTTRQAHNAAAVVEVNFTADTWNDHVDGLLVSLEQDGTLKDDVVDTDQIADGAVEEAQIGTGAVSNAKLKTGTGEPGGAWTSYTPVLGAAGGSPAIGNGTITGKYFRIGRFVQVQFQIVDGNTTNWGTGLVTITLPFSAATSVGTNPNVGSLILRDQGSRDYNGQVRIDAPTTPTVASLNYFTVNGTTIDTAAITTSAPITISDADSIRGEFSYEALT